MEEVKEVDYWIEDIYRLTEFQHIVDCCNYPVEQAIDCPLIHYDRVKDEHTGEIISVKGRTNVTPDEVAASYRNVRDILKRIIRKQVSDGDIEILDRESRSTFQNGERVRIDKDGIQVVKIYEHFDGQGNRVKEDYTNVWLAYRQELYRKIWNYYFYRSNLDKEIMLKGDSIQFCECTECEHLVYFRGSGGRKYCSKVCLNRQNVRNYRKRESGTSKVAF